MCHEICLDCTTQYDDINKYDKDIINRILFKIQENLMLQLRSITDRQKEADDTSGYAKLISRMEDDNALAKKKDGQKARQVH